MEHTKGLLAPAATSDPRANVAPSPADHRTMIMEAGNTGDRPGYLTGATQR